MIVKGSHEITEIGVDDNNVLLCHCKYKLKRDMMCYLYVIALSYIPSKEVDIDDKYFRCSQCLKDFPVGVKDV